MANKTIRFGNVLDVKEGIIIHGCNARGVMGGGVAAEVKARWPGAFSAYYAKCKANIAEPSTILGEIIWYQAGPQLWIANAITQANFGRDPSVRYVRYDAVQQSFRKVAEEAFNLKLSVHYPMIGAGLGNGDWSLIHEIINNEFIAYPSVHHSLWLMQP
jgi:O-acetyl-ADP-ribose deacetylase (regulator of RNase III)